MSKNNQIKDDDQKTFRDAMSGVVPLKGSTKVTLEPVRPKPVVRKKSSPELLQMELSDHENLAQVSSEEVIEFHRAGIQHKILRKLRAGQYNVEAILDLHGMSVAEARTSLQHFLLQCHKTGIRHVLIIHGKGRSNGKPILKNKLNHWLREITSVLAFCSATARNGRGGALYILLKNLKGEIL